MLATENLSTLQSPLTERGDRYRGAVCYVGPASLGQVANGRPCR